MKIEVIIGAIIVAAAIVLAPIALHAYKVNECINAQTHFKDSAEYRCIKTVNGAL